MSVLAESLVSIGVKGQNVVLAEINKVKKQAAAVSKMRPGVDLGKGLGKFRPGGGTPAAPSPADKKNEETSKREEKSNNKLAKGLKSFGGHVTDFVKAASGLDPVTTMHGITNAAAKMAGGWSAFGFSGAGIAQGIGELMNAGVSMASGAVHSAKQSAAEQYGLTTRNATTANYGGNLIQQYDAGKKGGSVGVARMSNPEKAQLVSVISGSFGKIQEPLAKELNKLSGKKDTGALSRVGAGDWQSMGTDKGWFLQQIANQFQGLPPSVAQKFQAELLKNYGGEIQDKTAAQRGAQATNAGWVSQNESQTAKLYEAAAANVTALYKLSASFNDIQIKLVNSGGTLAGTVDKMASAVNSAMAKLQSGKVGK
jgi:hypothetical protein